MGSRKSTLYVATTTENQPPGIVDFETDKLSEGRAQRCARGTGTALVSYSALEAPTVRIVDPDTQTECPPGTTGEIWVHGANVGPAIGKIPKRPSAPSEASSSIRRPAHPKGLGCGPGIWASYPMASCSSSAASRIC